MKYIKSNKTNGWPPAVSLLPKAQMKGEKEQGAESMKHNTTLLVHHEQKPKQRKDRKYNRYKLQVLLSTVSITILVGLRKRKGKI